MKTPIIIIACVLVCVSGFPYPRPDEGYAPIPVYGQPAPAYVAEPGPVGRVKMQIYRGPSDGKGYEVFAPWGFYVTQPHDAVIPGYH